VRTIYRDMDTLVLSGVPVAGERGIGYMMTAPITLPPLNLTLTELEALHLGMAVVGEAADDELKDALPVSGRRRGLSLYAANPQGDPVASEAQDRV